MILFVAHIQQSIAPSQYILPSGFEIIRIPGVGHIVGVVGIVHQQVHLDAEVAVANTAHILYVGPVHSSQEVAFVVIGAGELPRCFSGAADALLRRPASRWEGIPGHWFPQYNTPLTASREASPNERRLRSALPVSA